MHTRPVGLASVCRTCRSFFRRKSGGRRSDFSTSNVYVVLLPGHRLGARYDVSDIGIFVTCGGVVVGVVAIALAIHALAKLLFAFALLL